MYGAAVADFWFLCTQGPQTSKRKRFADKQSIKNLENHMLQAEVEKCPFHRQKTQKTVHFCIKTGTAFEPKRRALSGNLAVDVGQRGVACRAMRLRKSAVSVRDVSISCKVFSQIHTEKNDSNHKKSIFSQPYNLRFSYLCRQFRAHWRALRPDTCTNGQRQNAHRQQPQKRTKTNKQEHTYHDTTS